MFERFCDVVDTGTPMIEDRLRYEDELPDGTVVAGWWNLQVVRFDDGYLAASRDVTDVVLAEQAAAEVAKAAERETIAVELLQRAALPGRLPQSTWLEFGAAYRPAASGQPIGGDWYDAFDLGNGRICLVIGDVSGHGQEAAAYMLQVRNAVRAMATRETRPGRIMAAVNHVLETVEHRAPFVTACVATLDETTHTFTWSLAGHPPPMLARDGSVSTMEVPPGPPLGIFASATWPEERLKLCSGDRIITYTDGLIERRGEIIDVGLARLEGTIAATIGLEPEALAGHLADSVDQPTDDQAILCMKVKTTPPGTSPKPRVSRSC